MKYLQAALATGAAMAALACGAQGPDSAGTGSHPVAGGQWAPSPLDSWPAPEAAIRFEGCRAYGGITVETVIEEPVFENVQGGYGITERGVPYVFIATPVIQLHDQLQQFLYYHVCAHHLLQHAAIRVTSDTLDLASAEYDANCHAASHLLADSIYTRRDIDFILLALENNSGLERPPSQSQQLVSCLRERGLYQ